jgi:hypothetical protein
LESTTQIADERREAGAQDLEFLIVDEFLGTIVGARALKPPSSSGWSTA